jgi:hypothetical protein
MMSDNVNACSPFAAHEKLCDLTVPINLEKLRSSGGSGITFMNTATNDRTEKTTISLVALMNNGDHIMVFYDESSLDSLEDFAKNLLDHVRDVKKQNQAMGGESIHDKSS